MQTSRDSSIWRSLAVAFGDGLAFGVGMKLTQNAPPRPSGALALEPKAAPLSGRLEQLEQRLAQIEQTPPAAPAPAAPFDQRVLEAVVHALDARLQEQASQVEQRLAEIESKVAAELQALRRQDDTLASAVGAHMEELQDHFIAQLEAVRQQAEQDRAAMPREVASAVKAASGAAIEESLAPVRAEAAEKDREIADLRQKVEESDSAMLELLNGIGDLIQQAAGRKTASPPPGAAGPLAAFPAPEPQPPATPPPDSPAPLDGISPAAGHEADETVMDAPLPSFAQAAKPGRLWRVPLVSSMVAAVSACGILMMHYW
jgi:hypothetical protein